MTRPSIRFGIWALVHGSRAALQVKVNDRVLFTSYAGNEIKADGEEYLLMSEDDILGIVS